MKTRIPIFVSNVYFPADKPGGQPRAWLQLQDDADDHFLRIAVPYEFAREVAARIETLDENEFFRVWLEIGPEIQEGEL